jgi:beta-glucosidase
MQRVDEDFNLAQDEINLINTVSSLHAQGKK